jgi:hypothetical protein
VPPEGEQVADTIAPETVSDLAVVQVTVVGLPHPDAATGTVSHRVMHEASV